jgi:hypothetical protein
LLTTPSTHASRGWLRLGGVILFLVLFPVAACTGGTGLASPTASSPATVPPVVSASPSSTAAAIALQVALKPLLVASTFETTVKLDGAVVLTAKGRSVGEASQTTATTAGKTVEYIQIPPVAWAREGAGAWTLVAGETAPVAPLGVLAAPLTLAVAAGSAGSLIATYPAAALGLEGGPVTVAIAIEGATITFTFEGNTSGHTTSSTTTLRPGTTESIVAPS